MVSQEIIHWKLLFSWSPSEGKIQDGVQQRLNTLIFQSCAHQHWGEETLHCGPADCSLEDSKGTQDHGLTLDPSHGTQNQHGSIQHPQRSLHFNADWMVMPLCLSSSMESMVAPTPSLPFTCTSHEKGKRVVT
ncbi:hypothetical protein INR49_022111 [Caranx melampygus]|nr:hypothetical protein INR49_022111 [Caranx melampygus]